jgi:hypothetical protein
MDKKREKGEKTNVDGEVAFLHSSISPLTPLLHPCPFYPLILYSIKSFSIFHL